MRDVFEVYQSSQEWLPDYVWSSFRASGLSKAPSEAEISAHRGLLMCRTLAVSNIDVLAAYVCPDADWREPIKIAPGPVLTAEAPRTDLEQAINDLLAFVNIKAVSADELLLSFNKLKPFTLGNGRIGRALWMWRMTRGTSEEFDWLRSTRRAPSVPRLHS